MPARPGHPSSRQRLGLLALGLGAAWLSLAVTLDQVVGRRSPEAVASWAIGGATSMALRAERMAVPGAPPARLGEAERLALAALAREPVSVPAVRVLAQVAALRGNLAGADRLFGYSEKLSRRDLVTQLWQIEAAVRRGDAPGALVHYDRALRTVRRARPLLFPILASAASDPGVARPLGRLLVRRPAWGLDFLASMADDPQADAAALGSLLGQVNLSDAQPSERAPLAAGLARLVAAGRYVQAHGLYRRAVGPVTDGVGFDREPLLPPFDWSMVDEGDLSATLEPRAPGQAATLALRASNGRAGEFARRLLVLAAGRYRLDFSSSGAAANPATRAAVRLECVNGTGLLRVPLAAVNPSRLGGAFDVPAAGCPAQWLVVAAPTGLGDADGSVSLADPSIRRIG